MTFFRGFCFLKYKKFSRRGFFFSFGLGLKSTGFHFRKYKKNFLLRKYKKSYPWRKYKKYRELQGIIWSFSWGGFFLILRLGLVSALDGFEN